MNIQMLKLMAVFICVFFNNSLVRADVTLPWSTTYNCAEWVQGQPVNCDGLTKAGDWTTADGSLEQITTAANNPAGDPNSRGQRHWKGDGNNGKDDDSGGLRITFTAPVNEAWIRWYARYEFGMEFQQWIYHKILYLKQPNGDNMNAVDMLVGIVDDQMTYYEQIGRQITHRAYYSGWRSIMGGNAADGQWHAYEVYYKKESTVGGIDGILRVWVDGVLKANFTSVQHGSALGRLGIVSNAWQYKLGQRDMYIDIDDTVIAITTPIGRDVSGNPMIGPIGWQQSILQPPLRLLIVQ